MICKHDLSLFDIPNFKQGDAIMFLGVEYCNIDEFVTWKLFHNGKEVSVRRSVGLEERRWSERLEKVPTYLLIEQFNDWFTFYKRVG